MKHLLDISIVAAHRDTMKTDIVVSLSGLRISQNSFRVGTRKAGQACG